MDNIKQKTEELNNTKKSIPNETRKKMSEKAKLRFKEGKHPCCGRHLSEETRRKISEAHKGMKHSEETKKKMCINRKGRISPNKGKKFSEVHKLKLSVARRKRIISEETKNKMRVSMKGRLPWNTGLHLSEEHRVKLSNLLRGENNPFYGRQHTTESKKKMSDKLKGRISPNKGKHYSEETKRKISEAKKGKKLSPEHIQHVKEGLKRNWPNGRPVSDKERKVASDRTKKQWENPEYRQHMIEFRKQYKHTDETKQKIAITNKGRQLSEETRKKIGLAHKGKKISEKQKKLVGEANRIIMKLLWQDKAFASKMVKSFNVKPTKLELKIYDILQEILPNQYLLNSKTVDFIIERKIPDFVAISQENKKIIEANGRHWHKDIDKEKKRLELFKSFGYDTLIIWDYELKDVEVLKQKILSFNESDHLTIEEEIKLGRLAVSKA